MILTASTITLTIIAALTLLAVVDLCIAEKREDLR